MANTRKLKSVQPRLEDILSRPEQRVAYEEASAALEAGRLVRALREQAGMTQLQLASLLDVIQPRVSAIEAGLGRDGPSYALLKRIVLACGGTWNIPTAVASCIPKAAPSVTAKARSIVAGSFIAE